MKNITIFAQIKFMERIEIGKKIKQHREANNITKYAVNKANNKLSFPLMASIEKGDKNYTIDSLREYLEAINLKMILK